MMMSLRRPVLRLAEFDLRAVGALEKTGVARLAARRRVEAGLVELDAPVFVNGGYDRLACRKIEIVTIEGIDWHGVSRCWFVRYCVYPDLPSARPEQAGPSTSGNPD